MRLQTLLPPFDQGPRQEESILVESLLSPSLEDSYSWLQSSPSWLLLSEGKSCWHYDLWHLLTRHLSANIYSFSWEEWKTFLDSWVRKMWFCWSDLTCSSVSISSHLILFLIFCFWSVGWRTAGVQSMLKPSRHLTPRETSLASIETINRRGRTWGLPEEPLLLPTRQVTLPLRCPETGITIILMLTWNQSFLLEVDQIRMEPESTTRDSETPMRSLWMPT